MPLSRNQSKIYTILMLCAAVLITNIAIAQSRYELEEFRLDKRCPAKVSWKLLSQKDNKFVYRGSHSMGSLNLVVDLNGSEPSAKATGDYINFSKLTFKAIEKGYDIELKIRLTNQTCTLNFEAVDVQKQADLESNEQTGLQKPNVSTPSAQPSKKLGKAKATCAELGFTIGTEKFGECVIKMIDVVND